jgi:hypothetical protein
MKQNKITPYRITQALALVWVLAALAKYFSGIDASIGHTHYNNYVIFTKAFYHLLDNTNLYIHYPSEHWDLYKYSPAFALCMGVLAWMPDWLGFSLFSLSNGWAVCAALMALPGWTTGEQTVWFRRFVVENPLICALLLYVAMELLSSIQNAQTNGWIAALLIGAFCCMERRKVWIATLLLTLSVYIKVLGLVGFALFLLYPQKGKFILSSAVWMLVFALLPLVVCTPSELWQQYQNWGVLLANDHSASYGLSVMGWWQRWFGWEGSKTGVVLAGAALFCVPFVRTKQYTRFRFRQLFLCSILLWVVIFNHKAESPSFIIAICGIAIWYFSRPRPRSDYWWLIVAFILTSLCTTDLVPRIFRTEIYHPYHLKSLPSIFIWVRIWYEQMRENFD